MDDVTFTIAFAKGYTVGELIRIKLKIHDLRYGSDTYKQAIDDVLEIIVNEIDKLKEGKDEY